MLDNCNLVLFVYLFRLYSHAVNSMLAPLKTFCLYLARYEYLFNFDNTFEIHDDIEVLKRMGMAYGLEKGRCTQDNLHKAVKMVPDALKPYVLGGY